MEISASASSVAASLTLHIAPTAGTIAASVRVSQVFTDESDDGLDPAPVLPVAMPKGKGKGRASEVPAGTEPAAKKPRKTRCPKPAAPIDRTGATLTSGVNKGMSMADRQEHPAVSLLARQRVIQSNNRYVHRCCLLFCFLARLSVTECAHSV